MPTTMHSKNKNYYSHCPLKKRPIFVVKEESPENLSMKRDDVNLRRGKKLEDKEEEADSKKPMLSEILYQSTFWPKTTSTHNSILSYFPFHPYPISYAPHHHHHPLLQPYNFPHHHLLLPVITATERDTSTSLLLSPPSPLQHRISSSLFAQPINKCINKVPTSVEKVKDRRQRLTQQSNTNNNNNNNINNIHQLNSSLSPTSYLSQSSFTSQSDLSLRSSSSPLSTSSVSDSLSTNFNIKSLLKTSPHKSWYADDFCDVKRSSEIIDVVNDDNLANDHHHRDDNDVDDDDDVVGGERRGRKNSSMRYKCSDCKKTYSTCSGLTKHQQFHCMANKNSRVQKTVTCNECGKSYSSTGALKMHIRTHTLPCKCHLCGKAFSRPWLLQGHIRTHTGEKPFKCNFCHRAFADRSNLRAHLQTHSDVKKYSCGVCSKTFSRMSLLTKHKEAGCSIMHKML